MKSPRRVNSLKNIAECKAELGSLEANGGVRRNESGKMIPLSAKAQHIVQHLFEIAGRHNSEAWSFLADEADWETRVAAPKRAAVVFETSVRYRMNSRPFDRGLTGADRQVERFQQRRKPVAANVGRR